MITTGSAPVRVLDQTDLTEHKVSLTTPRMEWLVLLIGYLFLFVLYQQWIEPWIRSYLLGSDWGCTEFLGRLQHR